MPNLECLEFPLNFEEFREVKTCVNVSQWLDDSSALAKIRKSDFFHLSADGASNAIGSVAELEVMQRSGRATAVDFNICFAHQTERSGGKASGMVKYKDGSHNESLGIMLAKNHEIQVRLTRGTKRLEIFRSVQERKGRTPPLGPDPANETRWGGTIDEVSRANMIMGDTMDTLDILLAPDGDDYSMLSPKEKETNDLSRFTYTDQDKKVLRQFEGASRPAKAFCKFLQGRND